MEKPSAKQTEEVASFRHFAIWWRDFYCHTISGSGSTLRPFHKLAFYERPASSSVCPWNGQRTLHLNLTPTTPTFTASPPWRRTNEHGTLGLDSLSSSPPLRNPLLRSGCCRRAVELNSRRRWTEIWLSFFDWWGRRWWREAFPCSYLLDAPAAVHARGVDIRHAEPLFVAIFF